MARDRSVSEDTGLGAGHEASIDTKSRPQMIGEEVARRWKNWLAVAVTAATTWFLYGINDTWSKDAIAFGLITAVLLGYTVTTLVSDIE